MTYTFRFQTGYLIHIPLEQFQGAGHSITVDTRVTAEGRDPVYLTRTEQLVVEHAANVEGETTGTFVVGEGAYRVEILMQDDQHRVCRSGWKIQAQRSGFVSQLSAPTPPGAVEELSAAGARAPSAKGGPRIGRLTILLPAAGMAPNRSALQPQEVDRLTDSVSALLEQLPVNSIRLIAFNLEQHSVLFQRDSVSRDEIGALNADLNKVRLGTVDYGVLRRQERPIDLLAGLVRAEVHNAQPPDAVIVLGPPSRFRSDPPSGGAQASPVPLFYLEYPFVRQPIPQSVAPQVMRRGPVVPPADELPPLIQEPVETADAIQRLVAACKGETLVVRTPNDLASAILRMDARIPKRASASEAPSTSKTPPLPETPATAAPPATNRAADQPVTEPTGGEDPVEVLTRLRGQVLEHARRIPNYTCVESIQRDSYEPVEGRAVLACGLLLERWKAPGFSNRLRLDRTDWLRFDVAMTSTREIYSWAGAKKFEEGEMDQLVPEGSIGTGPFASILLSIFESPDLTYVFDGEKQQDGRRLFQYSLEVPREQSSYRVKAGQEWVITGYRGSLLVDPKTSELVRLEVQTDELPPETSSCEVDSSMEFGMASLGEGDYLLPKITHQRFIGRDGSEGDNAMTFSACRQYQAESILSFEPGGPASQGQTSRAGVDLELPAGLPVTVELMTMVRPAEMAAGDLIQGRLAKPIEDARQKTLVPAGALVQGRVMRLETRYAPRLETTVVFRWETVQIGGVALPIVLRPNRQAAEVSAPATGQLRQRGMPVELPQPGEEQYAVIHVVGARAALESGSRSEWLTAK